MDPNDRLPFLDANATVRDRVDTFYRQREGPAWKPPRQAPLPTRREDGHLLVEHCTHPGPEYALNFDHPADHVHGAPEDALAQLEARMAELQYALEEARQTRSQAQADAGNAAAADPPAAPAPRPRLIPEVVIEPRRRPVPPQAQSEQP